MNLDKPYILSRPSHYLITCPDRCDEDARRSLISRTTIWDKTIDDHYYPKFTGCIWDSVVNPNGEDALRIPKGFNPESIKKAFPNHQWLNSGKGWDTREIEVNMKEEYSPRSNQQRRILSYLNRPASTDLIHASTGIGKTYCFLNVWSKWRVPLFGLFAQKAHLETFYNEIFKFLDIKEDEVFIVDSGTRSMKKGLDDIDRYKIYLGLYRTIHNQLHNSASTTKYGMRLKTQPLYIDFMSKAGIGAMLCDECHLEYQMVISVALTTNARRTTYLSATPSRTIWHEKKILELVFPRPKDRLTIMLRPRVEYVPVIWNSNPNYDDVNNCIVMGEKFSPANYSSYLMKHKVYSHWLNMLLFFMKKRFSDGSTGIAIVIGGKLDLVKKVIKDMEKLFPEKSVGNFTSLVKDQEERLKALQSDIVITTEKSFGASVNPLQIDTMLFCAPISSPVWLEQIAGRLRGTDSKPCLFYDLAEDKGFSKLRAQKSARKQTMKRIAFESHEDFKYDFYQKK